nr:Phospholipid glycerol acyltransferase domain containing protein [Haemonchus contortus]
MKLDKRLPISQIARSNLPSQFCDKRRVWRARCRVRGEDTGPIDTYRLFHRLIICCRLNLHPEKTPGISFCQTNAMFGRLNGVLFVLLLFLTSFLGSVFMLFPLLPFAYYGTKFWRICADRLVGYWLTFPASLVERVFGTAFHVTGDLILHDYPALIIMNHRTRLDWLFLWNVLYKMDPHLLTTEKISLKAPLKSIPGAGWAMGCGSYIFLERSFDCDKETMAAFVKYYKDTGNTYQALPTYVSCSGAAADAKLMKT